MVEALKKHPVRIVCIAFPIIVCLTVCYLILRPAPTSADPSDELYKVRGIDISAHNGEIDFDSVASQVDFVMLKVTEGGSWVDKSFERNYNLARKAGLKIGAYHYFRFDRPGMPQAINIYNNLWGKHLDLPLAIDVETAQNAAGVDHDVINERLHDMVRFLENHGISLMFYTNKRGYHDYVKKDFSVYPLWICSFTDPPVDGPWLFWQYTHSGRVAGVPSEVDMNVFNGSRDDFEAMITKNKWN